MAGIAPVGAGEDLTAARAPVTLGPVLHVVALELQTRLVEEPYLRRVHGAAYEEYARRVGRFVPGVGRLR